jgi:hypothetical protein
MKGMKAIHKIQIYACLLLLLFSCKEKQTDSLMQALTLAGENRPELEKVLAHYRENPSDSLKYRAAVFLIENMQGHYSVDPSLIEKIQPIYLEPSIRIVELVGTGKTMSVNARAISNQGSVFDRIKACLGLSNGYFFLFFAIRVVGQEPVLDGCMTLSDLDSESAQIICL